METCGRIILDNKWGFWKENVCFMEFIWDTPSQLELIFYLSSCIVVKFNQEEFNLVYKRRDCCIAAK